MNFILRTFVIILENYTKISTILHRSSPFCFEDATCFISVHEVVGENSGMSAEMLKGLYPWDPKKVSQWSYKISHLIPEIKIDTFANNVDTDEMAHIELYSVCNSVLDL